MKIINVHTLYTSFKKNIHKKPYQILGSMKSLTISTNNYSNFYNSSSNLFQKKTFKLPNETIYPLLRKSKSNVFSIKKQLNTFSLEQKRDKYKGLSVTAIATKREVKKVSQEIKSLKLIKNIKKRKNINFFICDDDYGGKYNKNNKINKYKIKYTKNIFPSLEKNNNFSPYKPFYLEEIKNPEERIKDFFKFLNSIFIEENYNNLKYDQNEIFGHKEEYLNYIKDEFNYFYRKEKEIDMKSFLYHSFRTKDYGRVELYLKSARIDIIDDTYKNNNVKLSINIPFSLICLVYLCNIGQLNYFIFFLLNKINVNEKINKNDILLEEDLTKLFLEILEIIKFENNDIKINFIKEEYERNNNKIFFLEKIQSVSETIRYNYFLSDFEKNSDIIKIIDNTFKMIYNTPNYINKNKINFYNNINYYKFLLLSKNSKYKIKFCMPEISMLFNDYEKQLNHFINKELFIYLYQNNFMDWDFYVLHYLFYQKSFRIFIGKFLSLKNNYNTFLTKKIINLVNKKISFYSNLDSKNDNPEKEKNKNIFPINNSYKKYNLSNIYLSKITLNETDLEFIFSSFNDSIYDKNKIYSNIDLYKLKSYTLYAFVNNINKPLIYEFNFNFKQMKILYYKSKFNNFDLFFKRLINIENDIISLDYSYFDSFSYMTNKEIYEYFYKLNENYKEENENEINSKINSLIIKIRDPHIEIISVDKTCNKIFKVDQYHIELNNHFLELLINNSVNDWMKLIEENKNLFDVKNFLKYKDSRVKRMKRKSMIKGKKKDFQSAFMQFLRLSSPDVSSKK